MRQARRNAAGYWFTGHCEKNRNGAGRLLQCLDCGRCLGHDAFEFQALMMATNQSCTKAFSVQVKTNASSFGFWLMGKKQQTMVSSKGAADSCVSIVARLVEN